MTNWDERMKEVLRISATDGSWGLDKDGKLFPCSKLNCSEKCIFSDKTSCREEREKWLNAEYEEPKEIDWDNDIDWSRVPVDTPVLVKLFESDEWMERHFAGKDGQHYLTWLNGKTSFTAYGKFTSLPWNFCKLAREEDIEKYQKKEKEYE